MVVNLPFLVLFLEMGQGGLEDFRFIQQVDTGVQARHHTGHVSFKLVGPDVVTLNTAEQLNRLGLLLKQTEIQEVPA